MHISLIGAGAWGTAMAMAASRHPAGHQVHLHVRDEAQADAMRQTGENARYLPGVRLPGSIHIASGPLATFVAAGGADRLVVVATPMAGLRGVLSAI